MKRIRVLPRSNRFLPLKRISRPIPVSNAPLHRVIRQAINPYELYIVNNAFRKKYETPLFNAEADEEGGNSGDINPFMFDYYSSIPASAPFPKFAAKKIYDYKMETYLNPPNSEGRSAYIYNPVEYDFLLLPKDIQEGHFFNGEDLPVVPFLQHLKQGAEEDLEYYQNPPDAADDEGNEEENEEREEEREERIAATKKDLEDVEKYLKFREYYLSKGLEDWEQDFVKKIETRAHDEYMRALERRDEAMREAQERRNREIEEGVMERREEQERQDRMIRQRQQQNSLLSPLKKKIVLAGLAAAAGASTILPLFLGSS